MKILVVEDEEKAARFLERGLKENGYTVDVLSDGEEGLNAALIHRYSVLIVDVVMPRLNGIELIQELRKAKIPVSIIMLTARDAVQDRVLGIEAGADVYLVKPYAFSEVLAYVKALSGRKLESKEHQIKVEDLELDFQTHKVRRGGKIIDLTSKEFALLAYLMRRKGQILSRTLIAEEIWGMNFDPGTNVVDVHIRRLRAKVDEPFAKKLIWTVRGSGYVLDAKD